MNVEHSHEFADLFPVPPEARTVMVFGGTFDPVHVAHITLSELVREKLGADWIVYVPAARSPMRNAGPIAAARDRLAMLRLAIAGRAACSVSPIELIAAEDVLPASMPDAGDRGNAAALPPPSYTVDTLRKLRVLAPHTTVLRLLIGADQAAQFHQWRQPREVIALAEPVVMLRAPSETADHLMAAIAPHWSPDDAAKWRSRIVEVPTMDVSATAVRAAALRGELDSADVARMLPAPVRDYIASRRLYKNP